MIEFIATVLSFICGIVLGTIFWAGISVLMAVFVDGRYRKFWRLFK